VASPLATRGCGNQHHDQQQTDPLVSATHKEQQTMTSTNPFSSEARRRAEEAASLQSALSRRGLLSLGGGLGLTAALAACGGSKTPPAATAPAGGNGGATYTGPNVTVKFWNGFTGADGVGIKQIVDKFNSENPKIKVEMNVYQWADFFQKLPAAVASGNGPNVAAIHVDDIGTAAAQNTIVPIQDIADALKMKESDFSPVVWQGGLYQNKRFGIPLDVHPLAMYWNKAVFKKAGLDPEKPPANKNDFEEALKTMKGKGIKGFWVSPFQFTGGLTFFGLIYQFGGSVLSEDMKSVTWDQDPAVQALTWMRSMVTDGYSPANVAQDADYVALHNNQNAININGIWQVNDTVRGQKNPEDFGATVMPQIGSKNGVWADSHQFVLPRQSSADPNVTQASQFFIKYVGENSLPWVKTGKIPASQTVLTSSEFKDLSPENKLAAELDYAHFPAALPGIADVLTQFWTGYQAAILGKADPAAALKDSAQKGNQILQSNQQKYGS
jgi:multiple sugar transport system substrate-binding protein